MARKPVPEEEHCSKVSISFQPEDYKKLLDYCQREERSMSWVIRKALREWFENHDN